MVKTLPLNVAIPVLDLRSHVPVAKKKPNIKQKQEYCNIFNKDLKNGPHQRKKTTTGLNETELNKSIYRYTLLKNLTLF